MKKFLFKRTVAVVAASALCITVATASATLTNLPGGIKHATSIKELSARILNTSAVEEKDYTTPKPLEEFDFQNEGYKNLYEKVLAEDGFIFGMDYDWFVTNLNNGKNMGDNQILGFKSTFNPLLTYWDLYNIKAMGYSCVNIWLFMDAEGIIFDDIGFAVGLQDKFKENITTVMNMCRELNLPICFSIQPHGEASNFGDGTGSENPVEIWNKYFQFYYRADARESYMKNVIKPLAEIFKGYQDVVMILDLTIENESNLTSDAEIGYFDNADYGTTWENFAAFLTDMNSTIKEIIPNAITSTEDVGGASHAYRKNDIGVDIIGMNRYNGDGVMADPTDMYLVKPFYVGEFNGGESGFDQWSQEYWGKIKTRFYPDAISKGYVGAFYFSYSTGGDPFILFDGLSSDYDGIRSYALSLSYQVNDLKKKHNGIEGGLDTPVLLCNKGGNEVYWIGGRGVSKFKLERSDDNCKTWKTIADNLDIDTISLSSGICKYTDETLKSGIDFCYRVTAYDDEGKSAVSVPNNIESFFVAKNILNDGSFEGGKLETGEKSEQWFNHSYGGAGALTTETSHSGKYSFKVDKGNGIGTGSYGKTYISVKVKPNTAYTLRFWCKGVKDCSMFSVRALTPEKEDAPSLSASWFGTMEDQENWVQVTQTMSVGDYDTIYIMINNGTGTDSVAYFDDFELMETR